MSRAGRKQRKRLRAARMWLERAKVAAIAWSRLAPDDPAYDALGTVWWAAETCYVQALINYLEVRGDDRRLFWRHVDAFWRYFDVFRFQWRDWLRERGLS